MPELDWGITSRWNSFAMLYTKPWIRDYGRPDKLNLEIHNCFELRFRGDGRKYDFDVMATRTSIDSKVSLKISIGLKPALQAIWSTHIYTKGGYEWETVRIPFYHFYQQHEDAKVMNQTILALDSITGLRFRLQDNVQEIYRFFTTYSRISFSMNSKGPFKFELDYIAAATDTQFRQFHNKSKVSYLLNLFFKYSFSL